MPANNLKLSPQFLARMAGLAYLIIIVAGAAGEMLVRNTIIVSGDAEATARNIAASPLLWRIGIAGDLVMHVCDVVVMVIFYVLFKPVNRILALMALLFNLIQTSVLVANKLNLLTPLFLLGDANYLKALDSHQLETLSYISIRAHGHGFGIGLIFFGFTCLINGYLIRKSEFLPRIIGVLMQIAGVCYLVNSFALILSPTLANSLFPLILLPPLIGELSFCLWLLVKGINITKWNERAAAA